ncbi:hypothetical protein J1605_001518, partial [Eschrichtius robustus]
ERRSAVWGAHGPAVAQQSSSEVSLGN